MREARTTPGTALPVVPRATPNAFPLSSSPYAAPPWQSGQPSPPPVERVARSWAIIDLPAFDPDMFERQRRIVLRVAAALIAVVILLAVLAGHC
jgi:hypothetical protein